MLDLLRNEKDTVKGETRYTNINIKVELGAKVKTVSEEFGIGAKSRRTE